MTESLLPVRGYPREDRRLQVWLTVPYLFGSLVMTGIYATLVPLDVPVLLVVFVTLVVVSTLVVLLISALATLRRLPTLEQDQWRGIEVETVRGWPGEWWTFLTLYAVQSATLLAVAVLGFRAGGEWAWGAAVASALGVWIGGWVLMAVIGRRHNEALSVGNSMVFHRANWGSETCSLASVTGAEPGVSGKVLIIESGTPVNRVVSPWPWPGKPPSAPNQMKVKTSLMGHSAQDLAAWLRTQVPSLGEPEPDQQHEEPSVFGRLRRRFGGRGR